MKWMAPIVFLLLANVFLFAHAVVPHHHHDSMHTDVISQSGVEKLAKAIPNTQAMAFLDWFKYSENTIDGQSRKKAYTLWESNLVGRSFYKRYEYPHPYRK